MTDKQRSYRIENLNKFFGSGASRIVALDSIDFEIASGELLVLLGPSGCGKSTAMRCIAGLESPNAGRIMFGDRAVLDTAGGIDVPPEGRNVGMVFQSYALWPHKTVRENIAYPLRARRLREGLQQGWVDDVARLVDCTNLLDRYPGQLSGGQQQRVALARGLVARPDLMLFDEPLSNLDALLRVRVRNDLHELHRRLGFAGVYVTHDQAEAFAIGDRVAVMQLGRLEQVGKPEDVFERPANEYVANFVGMTNAIRVSWANGRWRTATGEEVSMTPMPPSDGQASLRFRPAAAQLVDPGCEARGIRISGTFVDSVYAGGEYEVTLAHGEERIAAMAQADMLAGVGPGATLVVEVPQGRCAVFGSDGRRIVDDSKVAAVRLRAASR